MNYRQSHGMRSKRWLLLMILMANLLLCLYLKSLQTRPDYIAIDMERFFEYVPYDLEAYAPIKWPQNVHIPGIIEATLSNRSVPIQPINKPNFNFLILNSAKCNQLEHVPESGKPSPSLLMLIKSTPQNFDQRKAIRQTWGNEYCWGSLTVVRIFMLGKVPDTHPEWQQTIELEHSIYGDLIQQDFLDGYHNVTYKTMMGIEWAVTYCPKSQIIMFVDDDFFVHPERNVHILEQLQSYFDTSFIAGRFIPLSQPIRSQRNKWFLGLDEYPYDNYPPYFHAGHYYISMQLARQMRVAMWYTKYLRFDDVYLGLILMKLAYSRLDIQAIRIYSQMAFHLIRRYVSVHAYKQPADQMYSWQDMNCQSFCRSSSHLGTV